MKDAYYFPHDSNAQNDEKILLLRAAHGWQGYGLYWAIIERLRDSKDYRYSSHAQAGLALGLNHPLSDLQALLKTCFEVGLLVDDGETFYSPSLNNRMVQLDEKRARLIEAGRRGGIKSSQAKATLKPGLSHPQAVKESKVKESKEEDKDKDMRRRRSPFIKPSVQDISNYCLERRNNINPQQFFDHYESNGWRVGKNPMQDWRATVRTWEKNNFERGGINANAIPRPSSLQDRLLAREPKPIDKGIPRVPSMSGGMEFPEGVPILK